MTPNPPQYQMTALGAVFAVRKCTDELQTHRSHSPRVLVELTIDNRFYGVYDVAMLPNAMRTYVPEYAFEGTQPLSAIFPMPYTTETRSAMQMVERFLLSVACRYIEASTTDGGVHA